MQLDVTRAVVKGWCVIRVNGEVDVATAPQLRQALVDADAEGAANVVVDLAKVEFIDSTGLGVLVGGLKRVRLRGGAFLLTSVAPNIQKLFDITALSKIFDMRETVESATEYVPPQS